MADLRSNFTAARLRTFSTEVLVQAGMTPIDAALVADVLVWANLRGQDAHGVVRLPRYIHLLQSGEMNPRPNVRLWGDAIALVALDADRACGPIAMCRALEVAIERARGAGVGVVMVKHTTHTAALGYYTEKIALAGMAGIALAASAPNMAYHGARAAGVSTSPISIAVPGGQHGSIVLDMGTGVVALGKLRAAKRAGKPIPEGWALDAHGNPTTDPGAAVTPLPIAGPKGSGLALMIECLTSLAVGNAILAPDIQAGGSGKHRQNAFVMAIDIARLGSLDDYRRDVDALAGAIKSLPPDAAIGEVLLPGERGNRTQADREKSGISMSPAVRADLADLAARMGVQPLEEA